MDPMSHPSARCSARVTASTRLARLQNLDSAAVWVVVGLQLSEVAPG
jgi:hypothetical protein